MNLMTISIADRDSSDIYSRTFHTDSVHHFKKNILAWEAELNLRKYEVMTDEVFELSDYSDEILEALNELDVTF
jgi:hypothetical protein